MKRVTLGDIAAVSSGGTPDRKRSDFWNGSIPWVKTGEIRFNTIRDTEEKITPLALKESSARLYPAGTLLMAMYGQGKTRGQVARLGIGAAINQACAAISPERADDAAYLFQYLSLRYTDIRRLSNSGSQENLNAELIRSIPVVYPPEEVRGKIADILATWDEALEKLDALIDAKARRKRGLMQQLLTGKKRLKGFRESMHMVKASDLFLSRSERNERGYPILSVTQDQGTVLRADLERRIAHNAGNTCTYKVVRPGDFIISLRSFQGGLEYSAIEGAVSPAYQVIYPKERIDLAFFRHYFKSPDFIARLAIAVIGIRDGKQVNFADFGFVRIPCPELAMQQQIGKILDIADAELRLLHAQRTALDRQKRGLMQQLLSGRRRVKIAPSIKSKRKSKK